MENVHLSLCVIAKNEAAFIEACILSAASAVDEILVVDTGSTDSTSERAQNRGARVLHFPWNNDFSDARNFALSNISGDWVLFLDADEQLGGRARHDLRGHLSEISADIGVLRVLRFNFFATGGYFADDVARILRNCPELRYDGAVSESLETSATRAGIGAASTPFFINHFGHCKAQEARTSKSVGYLSLIEKRLVEHSGDAALRSRYALTLKKVGRLADAEEQSLLAVNSDPNCAEAWRHRAQLLRSQNRAQDALDAAYRAKALSPEYPGIFNLIGLVLMSLERYREADEAFSYAMVSDPRALHSAINRGLVAQAEGEYAKAIDFFLYAAAENDAFLSDCWTGRMEPDPYQHLDSETISRFAGLEYHLAMCERRQGKQLAHGG